MARAQIFKDSETEKLTVRFSRRPDSCVVTLYKPGGEELTAEAAATLGPETYLTGAAGFGQDDQRVVPVASIDDLEFLGTYHMINAARQKEAVQLLSVPASKGLTIDAPLQYTYAADDVLESPDVTRTITALESATAGYNYRARFTASMPDASVVIRDLVFDVVKTRLEQPVTADNIHEHDPLIHKLQTSNHRGTDWAVMLDKAFDGMFQDLITQGLKPDRYIDEERLAQLQVYKLKITLAESGLKVGEEQYPFEAARFFLKRYDRLLLEVCGKATFYDGNGNQTQDGIGETEPAPARRLV